MEGISKDMDDLKLSVKELKEENASLKREIQSMKYDILAMFQNPQQPPTQQSSSEPVFTPTLPNKWADPSLLTMEERKDVKFELFGKRLTSCEHGEEGGEPARFIKLRRNEEIRYDDDNDDDGLTNTYMGSFTAPIVGQYRFDVKGIMIARDSESLAKWYLCCVRSEDDAFDPQDPRNFDTDSDESDEEKKEAHRHIRDARKKVFKEKSKRQLLFTFGDDNKEQKEAVVGIHCDKGYRIWIAVDIEKGRFYTEENACMFTGRLTR